MIGSLIFGLCMFLWGVWVWAIISSIGTEPSNCSKCNKVDVSVKDCVVTVLPELKGDVLCFEGVVFLDLESYQELLLDAGHYERACDLQPHIDNIKIDKLLEEGKE